MTGGRSDSLCQADKSTRRLAAERFAPRAIALVPWLDALLLVVATFLFANATARVPGIPVSLPEAAFDSGERLPFLSVSVFPARNSGAERTMGRGGTLAAVAFLEDERYDLSSPRRVSAFCQDLAKAARRAGERTVAVYMDGDLTYRDVHGVARLVRDSGLDKAFFVNRAAREK